MFIVGMNYAGFLPEREPGEFSDSELDSAIAEFKRLMTEAEETDGHMSDTDIEREGEGALTQLAKGQARYAHCVNGAEFWITREG